MHFSSRADIDAAIDDVFQIMADFDGWERAALRRGAEVTRVDKPRREGPGASWRLRFRFKGRERQLQVQVTDVDRPKRLAFSADGKLFEGDLRFDLLSLAPRRTRMAVHLDIRPLTLGARLVLQSVKLAKGKAQTRLNRNMAALAAEIERRQTVAARP